MPRKEKNKIVRPDVKKPASTNGLDPAKEWSQTQSELGFNLSPEATESMLAAIVKSSEDPIISKNLNGIVTSWNDAAEKVFGYTAKEMIGTPITKLIPDDRLNEELMILGRLKKGEMVDHFETKRITKDKKILDISLTISPIRDGKGNIIGASKIARNITKQKEIERTIRETEERLAAIVRSSEDPIISKTLEGIVTSWNDAAEKVFGYTAKEMIGAPISRLIPGDRIHEEGQILERLRKGEMIDHFETKRITKDKRILDISLTVSPIRDGSGNVIGASKIARDITKQKLIDKLLRESGERFRIVADTAPVMIWMSDTTSGCNFFNQGWFEFTGRTQEEEIGFGWMKGIHPEDFRITQETYSSNFHQQKTFQMESRIRRNDGEYRWVTVHAKPYFDIDGSFLGYIGACIDITEQKSVNEELEKRVSQRTIELLQKNKELIDQKNFVETILDSSVDVITVFDKDLRYVALNRKGSAMYEKGKKIIGENVLDMFPQVRGSRMHENLLRAFKGETIHDTNYKSEVVDRKFENFFIPLKQVGGMPEEVLVIGHDITDLVEASDNLSAANELLEKKNRELEQTNNELASFSYIASHDLQEPLRKIRIFGKMIIEQHIQALSHSAKDYLQRMINASDRMQNLIEALLEFSRTNTSSKNFEKKNLNDIVKEAEKELSEVIAEKNAIIKTEKLPDLYIISFQFRQMLINIMSNSLKYSDENVRPEITITSSKVKAENIHEKDVVIGMDYCRLTIKDNGIGFEPQYAERIFELFQRLHGRNEYSGSGIGLAICKKIAKNHNGFIKAESNPGEGVSVHIYIPC